MGYARETSFDGDDGQGLQAMLNFLLSDEGTAENLKAKAEKARDNLKLPARERKAPVRFGFEADEPTGKKGGHQAEEEEESEQRFESEDGEEVIIMAGEDEGDGAGDDGTWENEDDVVVVRG